MEPINSNSNANSNANNRGLRAPPRGSKRKAGETWAIVPVNEPVNERELARRLAPINRAAAQSLLQSIAKKPRKGLAMRTVSAGSQGPSQLVTINSALVPVPGSQGNIGYVGMVNGQRVVADPVQGTYVLNEGYMSNAGTAERRPSRAGQFRNQTVNRIRRFAFGLNPSEKITLNKTEKNRLVKNLSIRQSTLSKIGKLQKQIQYQSGIAKNRRKSRPERDAAATKVVELQRSIGQLVKAHSNKIRNISIGNKNLKSFYNLPPVVGPNSKFVKVMGALRNYIQLPAKVFQKYFIDEVPLEPIRPAVPSSRSVRAANARRNVGMSKLELNLNTKFRNGALGKESAKRALNKWAKYTDIPLPTSRNGINRYLQNLANAGMIEITPINGNGNRRISVNNRLYGQR
jgi:hypothetical protein